MSDLQMTRRRKPKPHGGSGADPNADWRRFVLDQVGYDEVARERLAQRADRRRALRRFLRGVLAGLIVYALAFLAVQAVLGWRHGRFDRYLPKPREERSASALHRSREALPHEAPDRHVMLSNPLYPPAPVDDADDDDGAAPAAADEG